MKLRPRLPLVTAFTTAFVMDWLSKWFIVNKVMAPPQIIEVTPFFNLTLGFNAGVSFGLFREFFETRPLFLAALTSMIVLCLLVWAARVNDPRESAALGLIAGGAAGNIYDRAVYGAVTDFLDVHWADWHWPAFNLADVAITVGAMMLVFCSVLPGKNPAALVGREDG